MNGYDNWFRQINWNCSLVTLPLLVNEGRVPFSLHPIIKSWHSKIIVSSCVPIFNKISEAVHEIVSHLIYIGEEQSILFADNSILEAYL